MKRVLITFLLITTVALTHGQTNYQLLNAGFEQWDGDNTSEPTHWNTFSSSDGSYSGMASTNHHYRRAGGRPGTSGNYYLTLYTRSIMGVKANGNMTTGRIHCGSMSASSSDNYNYTQRSNSEHCQPFTATPDSMRVWVSFYANDANSEASVEVFIHGDCDFRTPNDVNNKSLYWGHARAAFKRTTTSASSPSWQKITVPFIYDGNTTPSYVIVNLTSNTEAGAGSANDSLMVDDIEFLYSNWLASIWIGGHRMHEFNKGRMEYFFHVDKAELLNPGAIFAKAEAGDATVTYNHNMVDDSTLESVITVTGEDGQEREYHLTLTTGPADETLGIPQAEPLRPEAYPNPVKDRLHLNGQGYASLLDMNGREVMGGMLNGTATWNLSPLPDGTYLLQIDKHKQIIIKK